MARLAARGIAAGGAVRWGRRRTAGHLSLSIAGDRLLSMYVGHP